MSNYEIGKDVQALRSKLQAGVSPLTVQRTLGHDRLETTVDNSDLYAGHKDFNEFWVSSKGQAKSL